MKKRKNIMLVGSDYKRKGLEETLERNHFDIKKTIFDKVKDHYNQAIEIYEEGCVDAFISDRIYISHLCKYVREHKKDSETPLIVISPWRFSYKDVIKELFSNGSDVTKIKDGNVKIIEPLNDIGMQDIVYRTLVRYLWGKIPENELKKYDNRLTNYGLDNEPR